MRLRKFSLSFLIMVAVGMAQLLCLDAMAEFRHGLVAEVGAPFHHDGTANRDAVHHDRLTAPWDEAHRTQVAARRWVQSQRDPEVPGKAARGDERSAEPMALSVRDLVQLVRQKNEQILIQDQEWGIAQEAVEGAKAIFEPAFVSSYQHEDLSQRNTVREIVSLGFIPVFAEKSNRYGGAIETLAPTGARFRLGYDLRAFRNTLDEQYGVNREYKTFLGASVTQPLLKNGGMTTTMAEIRVAEADADIAFQTYREQTMRSISDAIATYWDLALSQKIYDVRKASVRIAEELLRDNEERVRTGKMAETEVFEARAGLDRRKSFLSEAKQAIVTTTNRVRTLFSSSTAEKNMQITATDPLDTEVLELDYGDSLVKALKLRPEYISTRRKVEREDIRLVFAKNQRWPQLDLTGSYGLNGLSDSFSGSWDDAWDHDFKTWSIGVELRIPLTGDRKSRSELEATKKRKKQALLELKAIEVNLANAVDTAIQSVRSTQEQVRYFSNVEDSRERLLRAEIARFDAGKSNSRLLLEKEEELHFAREAKLNSIVNHKKALLDLELAEGSLLLNYDVDIMEEDL